MIQIVAEGGFGKSSLAAWGFDHCQEFEIPFEKRVWVNLGRSQSFDRFARYVLQELGHPVTDLQANDELLLRELVLRLNDPNGAVRMLVVLDQVEAAIERSEWDWYGQFLQEWAVKGRRSAVLVTSRSAVHSGSAIDLGGLSDAEGLLFFDRLGVMGEHRSALITLAKGHPLLLKLAASWTIETYDARVDDRAIDFFDKLFTNYTGDPKAGVAAIFSVIFEALPLALQELLCRVSVYRLPIDGAMAEAMEGTIEDLGILAGQGLLLLQGVDYVLHPLVAGLVRSRVTEEWQSDRYEEVHDSDSHQATKEEEISEDKSSNQSLAQSKKEGDIFTPFGNEFNEVLRSLLILFGMTFIIVLLGLLIKTPSRIKKEMPEPIRNQSSKLLKKNDPAIIKTSNPSSPQNI